MDGSAFDDWPPEVGEDDLNHVMTLDENGLSFSNQHMLSYENIFGHDGKHMAHIHDHSVPNTFHSSIYSKPNSSSHHHRDPKGEQASLSLSSNLFPELDGAHLTYQPSIRNPEDLFLLHSSWQPASMTSSMTSACNDMPDLTSSSSTSGSVSLCKYSAVPSHSHLRPSKHQRRKVPSSRSSSSFSDNPIKQKKSKSEKTGPGKTQPRKAMAQFEEALKAKYPKLSKGFQQQSQLLFAQFRLLMEKEIEDGNLEADFDEMSLTTSSTQDYSTSTDMLDSRCSTEISSSVSSTPRAQNIGLQEPTPMEVEPAERVKYYCTFPGCIVSRKDCSCRGKGCKCLRKREIYWSNSKVDLRRHEESDKHWPQESFMCLECPSAVIDPNDLHLEPRCAFCYFSLSMLGDERSHYLQCESAREMGKTFGRRDHLCGHLRDHHGLNDMGEITKTWNYPIDSDWPRQCGFCGVFFDTWDQRMKHIALHFENGFKIESWRLPFPGPRDKKPPSPFFSNYRKDGGDDDDDNDDGFGGYGGKARGKALDYGMSTFTSQGGQSEQSSSSQDHGPYPQQGYRRQSYKTGASYFDLSLIKSVRLLSSKQGWIEVKAQLNTDTTENWISASIAQRLGRVPQTTPKRTYKIGTYSTMRSSRVLRGVSCLVAGTTNKSVTEFRVATKITPIEVILGAGFISAMDRSNLVMESNISLQQEGDRQTSLSRFLGQPSKLSLALERYLNDPGDRIPALSATPRPIISQRKPRLRSPPLGISLAYMDSLMQAYGDYVENHSKPMRVLRLHCPRGGGKTHLARNYISHHRNDLDSGVFWINSKVCHEVKNSFWDIAVQAILQFPKGASIVTNLVQNLRRTIPPCFGGYFLPIPSKLPLGGLCSHLSSWSSAASFRGKGLPTRIRAISATRENCSANNTQFLDGGVLKSTNNYFEKPRGRILVELQFLRCMGFIPVDSVFADAKIDKLKTNDTVFVDNSNRIPRIISFITQGIQDIDRCLTISKLLDLSPVEIVEDHLEEKIEVNIKSDTSKRHGWKEVRSKSDIDASCIKELVSCEACTFHKASSLNPTSIATWAECVISKEMVSQEDIIEAVKRLKGIKTSVQKKMAAPTLSPQHQVNGLLDELMTANEAKNFERSIAELHRDYTVNLKSKPETDFITVYVKCTPFKDLNPDFSSGMEEINKLKGCPPSYLLTGGAVTIRIFEKIGGLVDETDPHHNLGVGQYIDLPRLVVSVDTSTAKNSVVEALAKVSFTRDDKSCRRGEREGTVRILLREWYAQNESSRVRSKSSQFLQSYDIDGRRGAERTNPALHFAFADPCVFDTIFSSLAQESIAKMEAPHQIIPMGDTLFSNPLQDIADSGNVIVSNDVDQEHPSKLDTLAYDQRIDKYGYNADVSLHSENPYPQLRRLSAVSHCPYRNQHSSKFPRQRWRRAYPEFGELFKYLKARIPTHRSSRFEGYPRQVHDYYAEGLAQNYDKNGYILIRGDGTTTRGSGLGSGSAAEKCYSYLHDLRQYLASIHWNKRGRKGPFPEKVKERARKALNMKACWTCFLNSSKTSNFSPRCSYLCPVIRGGIYQRPKHDGIRSKRCNNNSGVSRDENRLRRLQNGKHKMLSPRFKDPKSSTSASSATLNPDKRKDSPVVDNLNIGLTTSKLESLIYNQRIGKFGGPISAGLPQNASTLTFTSSNKEPRIAEPDSLDDRESSDYTQCQHLHYAEVKLIQPYDEIHTSSSFSIPCPEGLEREASLYNTYLPRAPNSGFSGLGHRCSAPFQNDVSCQIQQFHAGSVTDYSSSYHDPSFTLEQLYQDLHIQFLVSGDTGNKRRKLNDYFAEDVGLDKDVLWDFGHPGISENGSAFSASPWLATSPMMELPPLNSFAQDMKRSLEANSQPHDCSIFEPKDTL